MNVDELRAAENGLPWGGPAVPDPPLVCFPMPLSLDTRTDGEPYPPPLVTSDDPLRCVAPGPVAELGKLAGLMLWNVQITYSEGHLPHARLGTPSEKAKKIWALRMARGAQRAVAVRTDGSWTSLWTWSPQRMAARSRTLADFENQLGRDW